MSTELPGLYVLGCLNRHITVRSQQCRAINLIHALMRVGGGLDRKSVAIVGAGFAGLTAAAWALEKSTATVTLFDAAPRPLWLQDCCSNRWLHPGIYDWPLAGSLEPRTSLPVLNWRADTAGNVARQVRAEWERLVAGKASYSARFETRVAAVRAATDGRLLVELADGGSEAFDIVILAVGFGMEGEAVGRVSYWNDADGLDGVAAGSSVLVSGFGDGGLADVLRLCMPQYRQDSLVELVRQVPPEVCRQLAEWEERLRGNIPELDKRYQNLRVDRIVRELKSSQPAINLTFAGRGHLYGQRSAILNRFLVSQLRQAWGDAAFELVEAGVDGSSLTIAPDGRRRIKLNGDGTERIFDNVVLRLGPVPAYPRIEPLNAWAVGKERRKYWLDLPQSLDETRLPLWQDQDSAPIEAGSQQDFLAYESSSRPWCLVLEPPGTKIRWAIRAGEILQRLREDRVDDLNPKPLVLTSLDAFQDESSIKQAVRALCAADIVIADVTAYDEGVLLLLGIRAAVRRAVTITCTDQEVSAALWDNIPFNLKELKLISISNTRQGLSDMAEAVDVGLKQSKRSADYLDLPVYDYVRQDYPPDEVKPARVLLLRSFKAYEDDRAIFVLREIASALKPALRLSEPPSVETVIDQASPRLAGQRLYEAIRHWRTCVVDLTWWRPNVLFELGVRLAATTNPTFCLIDGDVDAPEPAAPMRAALRKFLQPFRYDLRMPNLADAFTTPLPQFVYATAAAHFRKKQDYPGLDVDEFLETAAPVKPGDPLQDVDLRQIYASHEGDYATELRYSSVEMRCAAWYYLADREQPHRFRPVDMLDPRRAEIFGRFQKLSARLKTDLAQRVEARDRRLCQEIERMIGESAVLGTPRMADQLAEWRAVRSELRSGFDVPQSDRGRSDFAAELGALVDDYKDRRSQLKELERLLMEMDSPVCTIPLQALRLDLGRFDVELERLERRSLHD